MRKFVLFLVVFGLLAGTSYAMGAEGHWDSGHGKGMIKTLEKLNLTEAQKHDVAVILKNSRAEGKALHESMRTAFMGLKQAIDSGAGEAAVREACKPVAKAGEDLAVHKAKVHAAIKAVLTPEQAKTLEQERSARMAKVHDKMKGRMDKRSSAMDSWIDEHAK
jgi:Spy/CpxP family protein refolding chaperone